MAEEEKLNLDANSTKPSLDKASGKAKRGALSRPEMEFIEKNIATKDLKELSKLIGKSIATIRKYAYKKNLVTKEDTKYSTDAFRDKRCKDILRHREYWAELKMQFGPEELKQFESLWIGMYIQFNEDIQTTEDLQMKKYITLEIMKDRFGKQAFTCIKEIEELQKKLDIEQQKEKKDKDEIRFLKMMLREYQGNHMALTKNQRETMNEQKDVESKLKGSRDQRVKGYLDANENFMAALRLIHENPEVRENIGRHIEIMRLAQEKEREKLYGYHTYLDKTVDRLILNKDSVIGGEDIDA